MKQSTLAAAVSATLLGTSVFVGSAQAAPRVCDDGSRPPCQDTGEAAANNLSYPVIWSDGASILAPLPETEWAFEPITDPASECFTGDTGGLPVPEEFDCYFDVEAPVGANPQVWWLQQREANKWQAFNPLATQSVAITGVDWGDDLESRDNFNTRSIIRTEVVLLKNVVLDPTSEFDVDDFLAFQMSGAVPGTANSPVEMHGTNYGGPENPALGTQTLIDPTLVRPGFQATMYSACARFIIQKVVGDPASLQWNPADGHWGPVSSVNNPVFNGAVYPDALADDYSAEINVGGNLIYGYNWNLRKAGEGAGLYRLTYVLDGGGGMGGSCTTALNTSFAPEPEDPTMEPPATEVVNVVTNPVATPAIVPAGDAGLNGDLGGGLSYIDVVINAKTPGGGKK
jgi:hypothetical protein